MQLGKHPFVVNKERCGPTAISLISGIDPLIIRATVNEIRERPYNKPVMGLSNKHLIQTCLRLGLKPTARLAKRMRISVLSKGIWIAHVANHYVALVDGEIADTHIWWFIPIEQHYAYGRSFIKTAWRFD